MSAFARQGLSSNQSVLGIYDPVPVVLHDNYVATRFQYRYIVRVFRRESSTWIPIATLKRIPNATSSGAFDLSQLLRGSLEIGDPSNDPNSTVDNPCSFSNNAEFFRIDIGSEYAFTDGGTINEYMTDTYYTGAIAARYLDEFQAWGTDVIASKFVLKSTGSYKQFLTEREPTYFKYAGQQHYGYVVALPRRLMKMTMSFLSTDNTAPYDTDANKLFVGIGVLNTQFGQAEVNLKDPQDVSNTSFGLGMNLSDGGLVRDLHVGYADIETYDWATNIQGSTQWDRMFVQIRAQSDSTARSLPVLFTLGDCGQDGVQFKFLNRFGGYDYVFCTGYTEKTTDYTRETFSTGTGNWHTADGVTTLLQTNDPNKRQTKSNVTREKRKFRAHTGYVKPEDNELVMALLGSKRVYATKFVTPRSAPEDDYYPVVITNSSMKAMYQQTDKLIEYTIEFEYANNPRPMV